MGINEEVARRTAGVMRSIRRRGALAVRDRVAGEDAATRAGEIWGSPGERWFSSADPICRVHGDASMYAGGLRALLLQALHPLAMAGVASHSGYQDDPWGRLQRTGGYIATTTFGTIADAEATIAQVREIHQRIVGVAPDGRRFSASDPTLLRWVHLAEIESFLMAYQAFGAGRLTPAEADTYVAQSGVSAQLLGVPDPPTSVAEMHEQLASYRPLLQDTEGSREVARFLLRRPPVSGLARLGYQGLATGGVWLLEPWARTMLHLDDPGELGRRIGLGSTRLVRWLMADDSVQHPALGSAA